MELAGRVLGEFVVRERIGAGGFGEVYRAEQPVLAREAVVKVARALDGEESVRRFLREAQLASRLDHPYAAHVYAFGAEADGLLWIAMELVRGSTLASLLETQGRLPVDRFVPFFERLCEVVHDAHERGIVHRDIKPQNVMVMNRAGRLLPKLLDLGIARLADGQPEDGRPRVGSPHYMAPEQWRDAGAVDRRADVYALGVLAYQALAGRRPFDAATLEEIAGAHARAPVPPLGDGFPAALDGWFARALAKSPADRPESALALADGLRAAAGLASEVENLPGLDQALREAWTSRAPQPLAEAVAALEAARNPHQAWNAAGVLVGTLVRWLGLLALACRGRAASAGDDPMSEALRRLRRSGLDDAGWIGLGRELVRPFAGARDVHPLPDLVRIFLDEERGLLDEALAVTRPAPPAEDVLIGQLGAGLGVLDRLMRAVGFLLDHPLAVARGARAERWIGVRRRRRVALPTVGRAIVPDGAALLLDGDGAAILALAPLVQIAAPSPGADEECFLLDGAGPLGARLTAWPYGFERQDEGPWAWLAATFAGEGEEARPSGVGARPPWPGLAAFTGADADLYCGREREVEAFANRLRAQPLLAVVGPSGAGKSSFVQAGVLPALSASWSAVTLRPGPQPMAALAARLRRSGIPLEGDGADPDRAGAALRAAAENSGPFILVVDQFEEVFTLCRDPIERDRFAAVLAGAARSADDPVRVVLTVRDDFLVRCDRLAALRHRLATGLAVLATPAPADLRRILVEPAARAGYEFDDPELPDRMVAEVAGEEGALVLLSFTAAKLWEMRDRQFRQLRARSFESLGGVGGALARHAEAVLAGLTAAEQRVVREAFRQLVTAEGTRAVLGKGELADMLGGDAARSVVDRLVEARLLTASESEAGEDRIEIVHEALLAAWPRLVEWRREDEEGARFRDQIRAAAEQWAARGRPRGLLWRDEALAEYRLWRARFPGPLPATAEEFAGASVEEAARGRRVRRAALVAVLVALTAGVVVLYRASGREEAQRRRAEDRLVQFYEEQGRQALLAGHPLEGLVYLTEAYRRGADGAALRVMLADAARPLAAELVRLPGHAGRVWSAEYDPAGERIVTAGDDGAVRIFLAGGAPARVLGGHAGRIIRARFVDGGRLVLTASADGTARLFEVNGGAERGVFAAGGEVFDAALAPDGRSLATASWTGEGEGVVRLWQVASGAPHCTPPDGEAIVNAIAFSPDSELVAAAAGDGTARVWEVAGCRPRALVRHAAHVQHLAFDASGGSLLTASWDGTARISDPRTGETRATLVGHSDKVEHAAFSPDGRRVVTASRDATARVWDAGSGRLLAVLVGHTGPLNLAAFDPSGRRVVTASYDATARIWDAASGRPLAALHGHAGVILTAAFDPQGGRVVTSSWDGTARVWDAGEQAGLARTLAPPAPSARRLAIDRRGQVALGRGTRVEVRSALDGALVARLEGASAAIRSVAIAPDGDRVMAASREGRAWVWDVARGEVLAELDWPVGLDVAAPLAAHPLRLLAEPHPWLEAGTSALAVRRDGRRVATGEDSGHLEVWDPERPRPRAATGGHGGPIDMVVFSPDGKRIATAGAPAHAARVWDAESLAPLAELSGHTGRIMDLEFSHRGDRLLTASEDGTVRAWDGRGGRELLGALEGHADFVTGVALSSDDRLIATSSGDGTIRLWDGSSYRMIGVRDARAGFVFDVGFTPDGERVLSLDASGALLSWDVHRERRTAAELAALVACRVPFRLDEATGRLLPVNPAELERRCPR